MANVKLGNKIYENVETVKLDTADGGTVEFADRDAAVEAGIAQGKQEAYDVFWDSYQEGGNRTDYRYAFAYTKWDDVIFNPKYPLKFVGDASCAFVAALFKWEDKVLNVDLSEATYLYWVFRNNKFTHLGKCDLSSALDIRGAFSFNFNLKSIQEIVSTESLVWSDAFTNDSSLESITFSGVIGTSISFVDSSKLAAASAQSVIDHLKDLSGASSQTLTLHAAVGANLTEEQKAAITAKNWTLVY